MPARIFVVRAPASARVIRVSPQGPKGAKGNQGESGRLSRRAAWDPAGISYLGSAVHGSAESAAVWRIVRITVASNGTCTTGTATNVKWTDRYTATYT